MEEIRNDDSVIDRGGCTVFGENISPTLIAGYYKMVGNTQDAMTVVVLGDRTNGRTEDIQKTSSPDG